MSGDHMSSLPAVNVKGQWLSGAGVAVDDVLLQCCPGHDGLSQSLGPVNALEYGSDGKGRKPGIAPPSQRPGPILASVPVAVAPTFRESQSIRARSDMPALSSARRFFAERVSSVVAEEGLWIVGSVS